jgi:hypothetical protein
MVEKKRKRLIMKQFLLTELACLPETVLRDFFFSIQAKLVDVFAVQQLLHLSWHGSWVHCLWSHPGT